MKTFDWADLLHHHPIFSALKHKEVQELLQEEASKEHHHAAGTTILHVGEVGDSILLIGAGSLDAILPLDGGKQIKLSEMRKGEVFGEMGFLEGRPRAATVIAREACTLLEIGGRDFRKTLDVHPEIEVKLLLTISERLRQANDQLLNLHLHGIDEKLQLFNTKLDVEHRIVDTSLRAAQTVFDQTKQRADEVISSFERTRNLLQITAVVIAAIIALGGLGIGYWGQDKMKVIQDMEKGVVKDLEEMGKRIAKSTESAEDNEKSIRDTAKKIKETKETMIQVLSASFVVAVNGNDNEGANDIYAQLHPLKEPKETMTFNDSQFWRVERQIKIKGAKDWSDLLNAMVAKHKDAEADQTRAYYLLLLNSLLNKPDEFSTTLARFKEAAVEQKRRGVKAHRSNEEMLNRLLKFVEDTGDQTKRESFDKVRAKAP